MCELVSGLVDLSVDMQWFDVDGSMVDWTLVGHILKVDAVICSWKDSHAVYIFPASVKYVLLVISYHYYTNFDINQLHLIYQKVDRHEYHSIFLIWRLFLTFWYEKK